MFSVQVWKAFVAYQELLVASEYLGRERAMGVIFYTLGEFPTREEYLYFVESQDTSNASFAAARQYSLIAREIYDAKIKVKHLFFIWQSKLISKVSFIYTEKKHLVKLTDT